ncbi:hypothetical protein D9M68_422370 [compost metagenome]
MPGERDNCHREFPARAARPSDPPHRPPRHGRVLRVGRAAALSAAQGPAGGDRRRPAPRRRGDPRAARRRHAGRHSGRGLSAAEGLHGARRDHHRHLPRPAVRHRLGHGAHEGRQAVPAGADPAGRFRRVPALLAHLQAGDPGHRTAHGRPRRGRGLHRLHRRARRPARGRARAGAAHSEKHLPGHRHHLLHRRGTQQAHRQDGERIQQAQRHQHRLARRPAGKDLAAALPQGQRRGAQGR